MPSWATAVWEGFFIVWAKSTFIWRHTARWMIVRPRGREWCEPSAQALGMTTTHDVGQQVSEIHAKGERTNEYITT